jgi:membrane protein DedA with SNARE-associated domain
MTAGMMRISLTRYITINVLCGIVWIFCVMLTGYYFGNVLAYIPKQFQIFGAIAVIVGFFVGVRALSKQLAKTDW